MSKILDNTKNFYQFLDEFKPEIACFEEYKQVRLINALREMFANITPIATIDNKRLYRNCPITDLVKIYPEDDRVEFVGYQSPDKEQKAVLNFNEDGYTYITNYLVKKSDADKGVFERSVVKYPMRFDNEVVNELYYRGYCDNLFCNNGEIVEGWSSIIDKEMIKGIVKGNPLILYKSHSYKVIGKTSPEAIDYTYGVFQVVEGQKEYKYKVFRNCEEEYITDEDRKILATFLYEGRVPENNIFNYQTEPISEAGGEE